MAYVFKQEDRKYVYMHIPKTGGTSIEHALVDNGIHIQYLEGHVDLANIARMLSPEPISNYTAFTTVRNPWDWYVSWYHFLLKHRSDSDFLMEYKILDNGFEYFLNFIKDNRDELVFKNNGFSNRKYISMLEWASGTSDIHFFKMEDLDRPDLFDSIKLDLDVSEYRVNTSQRGPYQDYYNENSKQLVYSMHEADINYFEYTF